MTSRPVALLGNNTGFKLNYMNASLTLTDANNMSESNKRNTVLLLQKTSVYLGPWKVYLGVFVCGDTL